MIQSNTWLRRPRGTRAISPGLSRRRHLTKAAEHSSSSTSTSHGLPRTARAQRRSSEETRNERDLATYRDERISLLEVPVDDSGMENSLEQAEPEGGRLPA